MSRQVTALQFIQGVLDDASEHIPEGDYLQAMNHLKYLFDAHKPELAMDRGLPAAIQNAPRIYLAPQTGNTLPTNVLDAIFSQVAHTIRGATAPQRPARRRTRTIHDIPVGTRVWFGGNSDCEFVVERGYLRPRADTGVRYTSLAEAARSVPDANPRTRNWWADAMARTPSGRFSNAFHPLNTVVPPN